MKKLMIKKKKLFQIKCFYRKFITNLYYLYKYLKKIVES